MKRTRFTDEQIIGILGEHEAGAKCADLCRKHGMSEGTFYNWKAKFGGMTVSEAKRLKGLEDENAKLKKLLAEQMLDLAAMKDLVAKKWYGTERLTGALLDRLTHHVNILEMNGESYRLAQSRARNAGQTP